MRVSFHGCTLPDAQSKKMIILRKSIIPVIQNTSRHSFSSACNSNFIEVSHMNEAMSVKRTFGVRTPMIYGTRNPINAPRPFATLVMAPA